MKRFLAVFAALVAQTAAAQGSAAGWPSSVNFTNTVASTPFRAGGYGGYAPGATAPSPGTCGPGDYNANRSESWISVQPGTENLVGVSKVFFEKFSTFYNFQLGSIRFLNGVPGANNIVQGYECVSTGTQAMPPSWTNNTDPNVDFDTLGRAYQVTLPFNAFWANLHPDSNIGIVYSDNLGETWVKGNGGQPLESAPNSTSKTLGRVEDKQWVAVDRFPFPASPLTNRVYAAWSVFNGSTTKIKFTYSKDRGQSFKKPITLTAPSQTGPSNTWVYPSVDAGHNVYVAFMSSVDSPAASRRETIYVSRSADGGDTWGPFVAVANPVIRDGCCYANTTFRKGIVQSFAASRTFPGHLYMVWEDYDGVNDQYDVKFSQSIDFGQTWSVPIQVNDPDLNDQFQPQVASGPSGAVAVAFYDRRRPCPQDTAIGPGDAGRTNFCIDVTLQAFKDNGSGAEPVVGFGNVRITDFTFDPEQPLQTIDGLDQMACAAHQNPCLGPAFLGDYFGLAVSTSNIYALFVSTHYPSTVTGDGGATVMYQQQVLATVPRVEFGIGY